MSDRPTTPGSGADPDATTEFVLYGGKGGVGKTTVAAASGLASARAGRETLVVSTDPAHSLADSVGVDIGPEPTRIRGECWGVELGPEAGADRYRALFEALADDLAAAGVGIDEDALRDLFEAGVIPGSDELAAIEGLATYLEADRWDRVVFDTAPTGHTLRLLNLPAVMDRGLVTALDLRDRVRRRVDAARTMVFGPLGARRREGADEFAETRERMARVEAALRDPDRTEFRVVTLAETMSVRETDRLVARLRDLDVPVRTLVVNRVLEDDCDCDRCRAKRSVQDDALATLRETHPDLAVWTVPDEPGEVTGLDALERVADALERAAGEGGI